MTGADLIEELLYAEGVRRVYEVSGGMIAPLLDAVHRRGRIRLVSMRHEQAAAFAADAEGRLTGVPGVAAATSGPGATNLLTGIGSCYFDSTPAVFLTGQVNRHERSRGMPIRQLGFQELDVVAMARPIVKEAIEVESPDDLAGSLERAFAVARSGRPGPVLVDISLDVQTAAASSATGAFAPLEGPRAPADDLDAAIGTLAAARRPLVLAGGGVRAAGAAGPFRELVERLGVPVVTSLLGLDLLEDEHPLRVGMIGTYGNRWANLAVGRCDALLTLGSRLDIRQTGSDLAWFERDRAIIRVDCDEGELANRFPTARRIHADLRTFIPDLLGRAPAAGAWDAWQAEIAVLREAWPADAELDVSGVNPNAFLRELSGASAPADVVTADVGQHQMWAAQSFALRRGQRWVTSGGMGAMGSGLPLAIGAAFATGGPVLAVVGDAGFQSNLQELQTVAQHGLPLKIVVLNNGCHGMVKQFQETYFDGRHPSTVIGYSAPDFAAVAAAFGIDAASVRDPAEAGDGARRLWERPDEPFLLDVAVDPAANAFPKVAFGRPLTEMEPLATPTAIGSAARMG